jgi:hypothetical protein
MKFLKVLLSAFLAILIFLFLGWFIFVNSNNSTQNKIVTFIFEKAINYLKLDAKFENIHIDLDSNKLTIMDFSIIDHNIAIKLEKIDVNYHFVGLKNTFIISFANPIFNDTAII